MRGARLPSLLLAGAMLMSNPALAQDAEPVIATLGTVPCSDRLADHVVAPAEDHVAFARRLGELQRDYVDGRLDAVGLNRATHAAILEAPLVAHLVLGIGEWGPEGWPGTIALRRMLGAPDDPGARDAMRATREAVDAAGGATSLYEADMQAAYEMAVAEGLPPAEYARQVADLVTAFGADCGGDLAQYHLGQIVAVGIDGALGYGRPGTLAGTRPPGRAARAAEALPILETLGAPRATSALPFLVRYGLEGFLADEVPTLEIPAEVAPAVPTLAAAAARIAEAMPAELALQEEAMYR